MGCSDRQDALAAGGGTTLAPDRFPDQRFGKVQKSTTDLRFVKPSASSTGVPDQFV